ncbi:hypothetical protein Bca4012_045496 [Brassica carinata]
MNEESPSTPPALTNKPAGTPKKKFPVTPTSPLRRSEETPKEARKGIICGLAACGVKPQLKKQHPEEEQGKTSGGNDAEEITRTEFRRSQGYLIRIEEPEEDIDPVFLHCL